MSVPLVILRECIEMSLDEGENAKILCCYTGKGETWGTPGCLYRPRHYYSQRRAMIRGHFQRAAFQFLYGTEVGVLLKLIPDSY